MGSIKSCVMYLYMVLVQLAFAGNVILTKIALEKGLSSFVLIFYRYLSATVVLGVLAYTSERKQRCPLSFAIIAKIFILAMLGPIGWQTLYNAGLNFISPTVATALSNVFPAFTFLLAIVLKMESVKLKSSRGRAKVIGTTICFGGALLFTLWKGHQFEGIVRAPLIDIHQSASRVGSRSSKDDWIKGSVLTLSAQLAWSSFIVFQVKVYEVYPARLSINALMCFFATLQSSLLGLIFERKLASWKLDWNVQLLAILYAGIVISCPVYYLQTWCISKKGPVFYAMFSPLLLIFVSVFSTFVFAERLHLGSMIGATLIVVGLYSVLWGKREENLVSDIKGSQDKGKSSNDQNLI